MAGTWIFLPLSGGGGGGGGYYDPPVEDYESLPAIATPNEIRYVIAENAFYSFNSGIWIKAGNFEEPIAPGTETQYWRGDKTWQEITFEQAIDPGTETQYWRGDKTWQEITFEQEIEPGTETQYWRGDKTWQEITFEQEIEPGEETQYWRGDKTWQNLTTDVLITSDGSSLAASQKLGEVIASSEPTSLSSAGLGDTGIWGEAVSVLVPRGTWAISATAYVTQNDANLSNLVQAGLSTQSSPTAIERSMTASAAFLVTGDYEYSLSIGPKIFLFEEDTTVYLNTKFIYDSGTPFHGGFISGWRIR